MKMKQLIGNHRFLYNKGIEYYYHLPRGFYIPKKGEKMRVVVAVSLLAASEGSGDDRTNWAIFNLREEDGLGEPKAGCSI
jgi:hypothetical protein